MSEIVWVLMALAGIVVVDVVATVLIARAVFRRVRRSRALNGAALRTRARLSRGPQHEVLALRVRLNETLASGRAAVDVSVQGTGPRGELPRLFRRIEGEGLVLESQLRLMESERDLAALSAELPAARRRVDQVAALVRRVRSAVAVSLADPTDDALAALGSDVDREVAALHAGVQELHTLNGQDAAAAPRRTPTDHPQRH
jgi:hypothetical protein